MFLRKLLAAVAPLMLCAVLCVLFPLINSLGFLGNVLMGILLGTALAVIPLFCGAGTRKEPFIGMLAIPMVLLFCLLLYQYLTAMGMLNIPVLAFFNTASALVVLVESGFLGFMLVMLIKVRRK